MLWRASRRWTTYRLHSETHRLPVLNSRSCLLRPSSAARRESSTLSASALHRLDEPVLTLHRSSLGHKENVKLPIPEQKNKGQGHTRKQENVRRQSAPGTPIPDGLLHWLDELFTSVSSPAYVRQHINSKQEWLQFLNGAEHACRVAEELAQSDAPYRALYVLEAAHSIGLAFKQRAYERVVYHIAMSGEWNLVLSVSAAALRATGKTTARLLNWRGRALVALQDFAELDKLLGDFAKYGVKPQHRTYIIILQGHLRNHDLGRAKTIIRDMENAGFPVTESTYTVIVPAYRGFGLDSFIQGRGHDALSSNHILKGREKILNGLLRLYLDKHDLDGALQLLETFGSQPRAPDVENFTEPTNGVETTTGVTKIARRSILEDHATYTILINYLSRHGPSSLDGVLKRMRSCGGAPDMKVAASLIRMHYARGEEHVALVVLRDCFKHYSLPVDDLTSLGYDPQCPDSSTFGPFEGYPTIDLFNSVLRGVIQIRGLRAAVTVLKLMKDARMKPDVRTLEIFLWHLSKERPVLTEDLVNIMRSLLSSRIRPTLGALNILFKSIVHSAKRGKHKEGWNALAAYVRWEIQSLKVSESEQPIQRNKLRPEPTFDPNLCVTDLQSSVFHDVLLPIIQSLRERRVLADRATFSLRMRYDSLTLHPARAREAVARNLQIMRDRGLHPTVYHYAALMEAHCAAGNIRAAHEVLQDIIARGLVPQQKSRVVMYTILITANARIGRPDLALSIFREMLNANVVPDVAAIDALVGAFFAVKAFRLARRVLLDLWPMVAPFPMEMRDASLLDLITQLRAIRDRSEAPNPKFERSPLVNRQELIGLSNDVVAEWNDIVQAQAGDAQRAILPAKVEQPNKRATD